MAEFAYQGRGRTGERIEGRLEAATAQAAASQLQAEGIVPLRLEASRSPSPELDVGALWKQHFGRKRVPLEELAMFTRQIYSLTRAGVPIIRSLRGLAETSSERLSEVLLEVAADLEAGRGLSSAMQRHPDVFSSLFTSIVEVGETAGRLEEGFEQLTRYLELEQDSRRRIATATRYPIFVGVTIAVGITVLNIFVIPAFVGVFESFGSELPWATRLLIGVSDFFVRMWPALLGGAAAAFFGVRTWVHSESGRLRWDEWRLSIPVVGDILRRATLARFARTFALMLRAGVPVIQCLDSVARAVDNAFVGERIHDMRDAVQRGESLTRSAGGAKLFTPLVLQMLAVGEETGSVDDLLQEVAEFYEREVDYDLKRLADAIEPILIVAIGVVVLVLALGIYLPMWDLATAVKGGG